MAAAGYQVTDCVLYRNEPVRPRAVPDFDAVFFASASAVKAYCAWRSPDTLADKRVVAMGQPTLAELIKQGIGHASVPHTPGIRAALWHLACEITARELERLQ